MADKVQKIREVIEIVVNRRLNLLNGDYFDLNKEVDGFTNEIMDIINSMQEEPVSEELEEAALMHFNDVMEYEIKTGHKMAHMTSFKAGAKWQKVKDESTTEDLGKYINELSKQFPEVSFAKLSRIAVRVAKWQKKQMMAKAIDVEVKVDAGGYPYIPQMELYDYDKDVPLAKAGDKYKVVLIKEDKV